MPNVHAVRDSFNQIVGYLSSALILASLIVNQIGASVLLFGCLVGIGCGGTD
jgi:hypothetical protein